MIEPAAESRIGGSTMQRQRGISMAELLVALLILVIVITTTIAMFAERQTRLREASETILAWQVLANEAEIWRRIDFAQLDAAGNTFRSDTTLIRRFPEVAYDVSIEKPRSDVRKITFNIHWKQDQGPGQRSAALSILRADTGGSGLW
jgi:type II secretory pathway pseudopilin PulG